MTGIDVSLTKVSVKGTLANGVQDCSWGFWVMDNLPDVVTQESYDALCAELATPIEAFLGSGAVTKFWGALDQFTEISFYQYAINTTHARLVSIQNLSSPASGGGSSWHPKQTSIVVSLRSSVPGRSGRGRFYLPATGVAINDGGTFGTNSDIDNLATTAQTMFNALYAIPVQPCVASFTKAQALELAYIEIDNVPDTQRRRRDKIESTHTAIAGLTA